MNVDNQEILLSKIREAAKNLKGKLPDSLKHPDGRNPYAHICSIIKSTFGMSYKEVPDALIEHVEMVIDHCEKNPF